MPSGSGLICIFAVDPGTNTGIAWARIREEGIIEERLVGRSKGGAYTIDGSPLSQARQLWQHWQNWRLDCKQAGLPVELVIEDFVLTRMKSTERSGISPVRVTSSFLGYRQGLADAYEAGGYGPAEVVQAIFQQPSEAMGYATDERLKRWNMWTGFGEHEREAWKHLAFRVAKRKEAHG